jgi:ribosomal protein S18 acetylase RimI-like enzyme
MHKMKPPSAAVKRAKKALPPSEPAQLLAPQPTALSIRTVRGDDMKAVIELDALVTGIKKRDYWNSLYLRHEKTPAIGQHFLVATAGTKVVGFVIGEVRDWEFGSPPCGWVLAIDVCPQARLLGAATQLLQALCQGFRRARVTKVRTLLARENTLILSFFRSQGMMISPFIPLEMDLA